MELSEKERIVILEMMNQMNYKLKDFKFVLELEKKLKENLTIPKQSGDNL